jgi:hypothetical protein
MSTNNPSLVVQRLDRASDISSSSGLPYKCLVFPVTGGVQAIDAAGTVLPLVGPSGSLVPSADNIDDLGSLALRWKTGFFGTSVMTPLVTALQGGVEQPVASMIGTLATVNYLVLTSAATGNAPALSSDGSNTNISLTLSAKGTGSIALTSPETITPVAAASGTQTALTVTGAANLAQATTVEAPDVLFNLARTVTWAAGDITAQRAIKVTAPTYSIPAGAGTRTITTASTMSLSGAPALAAGTILARSYSLFVESGVTNLAGGVGVSNATNNNAATTISAVRLVDSAASGVAGVGANGIASRITLTAPNSAGTQTFAGFVTATITDVTAAAEVTQLSLGGAFANSGCEALRLIGLTGTIVNRIDVTPSASGSPVLFTATGDVNTSITIAGTGTGTISLNAGATGSVQLGGNAAALIGEFGVAPTARSGAIIDAAGGATVDAEARTAINTLLAYLRLRGTVTP